MMYKLSKDVGEKDSENKKFIVSLAIIGASAIGSAIYAVASVLGANAKFENNDMDN